MSASIPWSSSGSGDDYLSSQYNTKRSRSSDNSSSSKKFRSSSSEHRDLRYRTESPVTREHNGDENPSAVNSDPKPLVPEVSLSSQAQSILRSDGLLTTHNSLSVNNYRLFFAPR